MEQQRLDKLIAGGGKYSRKEAKALIRAGRVRVGGEVAKSAERKVAYGDEVRLDGVPLRNQKHLYIMLNKPMGVLCATKDSAQPTVLDLLPQELRRPGLFPAGRLDKDTEGFVLITDDGAFAHRILSPVSHVPKTYRAELSPGPLDERELARSFANGVELDGGEKCLPAELTVLENGVRPLVEVVICEGKYHQIKRMFARLSIQVEHLRRVKIGGLALDENLSGGQCREIVHKELDLICEGFGPLNMQNYEECK